MVRVICGFVLAGGFLDGVYGSTRVGRLFGKVRGRRPAALIIFALVYGGVFAQSAGGFCVGGGNGVCGGAAYGGQI